MSQVSAELRWFVDAASGADVEPLDRWFRGGASPPGGGKEARVDVYALDASTDELGAKDRGGKPGLEVKVLVQRDFSSIDFGSRRATAQLWSKVTSKVLSLPAEPAQRSALSKTRLLRKFDTTSPLAVEIPLGAGRFGEEPLHGALPDIGCNVEWTEVCAQGSPLAWRTFGLEAFAFGQSGSIDRALEDALRRTLRALTDALGPPPELSEAWRELSYPAWLVRPRG